MSENANCCEFMKQALNYAHDQSGRALQRSLPGLAQGFLFNKTSGKHTSSPVVYTIPGTGRGKGRTKTLNILINFCPFCGAKHQDAEKEGKKR